MTEMREENMSPKWEREGEGKILGLSRLSSEIRL